MLERSKSYRQLSESEEGRVLHSLDGKTGIKLWNKNAKGKGAFQKSASTLKQMVPSKRNKSRKKEGEQMLWCFIWMIAITKFFTKTRIDVKNYIVIKERNASLPGHPHMSRHALGKPEPNTNLELGIQKSQNKWSRTSQMKADSLRSCWTELTPASMSLQEWNCGDAESDKLEHFSK